MSIWTQLYLYQHSIPLVNPRGIRTFPLIILQYQCQYGHIFFCINTQYNSQSISIFQESDSGLMFIQISMLQIKLMDVIKGFASLYISVVKLITIQVRHNYLQKYIGQLNCNTRFAQLMISAFRFTDNAESNLSRCVQVYN